MTTRPNEYHLNWGQHMNVLKCSFDSMLSEDYLVDATIYCANKKIPVHKIILSACSAFFRDVFRDCDPHQCPIIIMPDDVKVEILTDLLEFIYKGEVNIEKDRLGEFFRSAKLLKIDVLTDCMPESGTKHLEVVPPMKTTSISAPFNPKSTPEEVLLTNLKQEIEVAEPQFEAICQNETDLVIVKRDLDEIEEEEDSLVQDNSKDCQYVDDEILDSSSNSNLPHDQVSLISLLNNRTSIPFKFKPELPQIDPLQSPSSPVDIQALNEDSKKMGPTVNSSVQQPVNILFDYPEPKIVFVETQKLHNYKTMMGSRRKRKIGRTKSFKCPDCDKIFKHQHSLAHHKSLHDGKTKCPICQLVLSRSYNLKRHLRTNHQLEM